MNRGRNNRERRFCGIGRDTSSLGKYINPIDDACGRVGYSVGVRSIFLLLTFSAALFGQNSLRQFLALTPAQTVQVQQLNDTLGQYFVSKQQRRNQVQQELDAEYAKASPDAQALGERYVELDGITHEIEEARAAVGVKVAALLTETQKGLLRRISVAIVQQGLYRDAVCGYLTDSFPSASGGASFGSSWFDTTSFYVPTVNLADFLFGATTTSSSGCGSDYPVSVRDYLSLTDAQVSAILNSAAAYQNLFSQQQARVADVQAEIRDETAKPSPDALALGSRYAELIGISRESARLGLQAGAASRALLTTPQLMKLQGPVAANSLLKFAYPAEGCHFIASPPGVQRYNYGGAFCPSNF